MPLTDPIGSITTFEHLGADGEVDFEKRDLHLADGSDKLSVSKDPWFASSG